jgi:hypothetical protein
MKRFVPSLIIVLLAVPAFGQDVDFGAFGDPGSLLTPTPPPAARGATPPRGAAPPVARPDRLVRLRDALLKAGTPLNTDQESALNKLLDAEIPEMRRTLQTHGRQMLAERAANSEPAAPPPVAAPRGAPPSSRVPPDILDALEVEMRQMNDALFTKIASSQALDTTQQSVLTKMARAQIRARGGFEALRISMEDAGTPLTTEQVPKVQELFEQQKTARAALARESQGTPDQARIQQLDRETLTKVVGLLMPAQRSALLALLKSQQSAPGAR